VRNIKGPTYLVTELTEWELEEEVEVDRKKRKRSDRPKKKQDQTDYVMESDIQNSTHKLRLTICRLPCLFHFSRPLLNGKSVLFFFHANGFRVQISQWHTSAIPSTP